VTPNQDGAGVVEVALAANAALNVQVVRARASVASYATTAGARSPWPSATTWC
jgi:hypothetical protein